MKHNKIMGIALALSVFAGTAVYAGFGCNGVSGMFGPNPDLEKVRSFQKETGGLRDEMMLKRIELTQEQAKSSPNKERVAAISKEMVDIRAKLQESATKLGLTGGCLTDCTMDPADCGQENCDKHAAKLGKDKKGSGCGNCNKKK